MNFQNINEYINAICFLALFIFWFSQAFKTNQVKKKVGGWGLRITAIVVIIFFVIISKYFNIQLWDYSVGLGLISNFITLIGLGIMIWSRIFLGKNWSANIVIKEQHELITTGPYSLVRHPIYSGLFLMVLGTSLFYGTLMNMIFAFIFFFGAYYKGQKEEKVLIEYFGDSYLKYKEKVKALIPLIF